MLALRRHLRWVPLRFGVSGILVGACHFATMTILVVWIDLHPQIALALAYSAALVLHFSLNRQFVFAADGSYALRLSVQGTRYLAVALISYALTSSAVALLPNVLNTSPLVVFYFLTGFLAVASFLVLRHWVFHRQAGLLNGAVPHSAEEA